MKRYLACLTAMALLLIGCQGGGVDSSAQPSSSSAPEQSQQQTQSPEQSAPGQEDPEPAPVSLSWTSESRGSWPFEQTVETIQFCGHSNPELEAANDSMRIDAENQIMYFDIALEKGEAQCREDGESWGSLWAYPVTGERYLSAVTVWREHMHFRIDETQTWNLVSSFVYDREEDRLISLEEAFDRMGVDQGTLEQEIREYAKAQNIGDYEGLSSIGFYMDPEGHPVFIIGADVYMTMAPAAWPTFFNWDNGEIRWSGEEPVPLYLVDTDWDDELSCLKGMGQYDGAAMISEEEAFDTLAEIAEVQDMLNQGMVMTSFGDTEYIDGEAHVCIAVGTDHEDQFVTETLYAVSWYSVYCMDPVSGAWNVVGFG